MFNIIRNVGKMNVENVKCLVQQIGRNSLVLGEATKLAKKNLPDFMALAFDLNPEEDKAFRKILTPRLSEAIVEFTHDAIERGADMDFEITPEPVEKDSESSITLTFEFVQTIPQQAGPGDPLPIEPVFKVKYGCKRV